MNQSAMNTKEFSNVKVKESKANKIGDIVYVLKRNEKRVLPYLKQGHFLCFCFFLICIWCSTHVFYLLFIAAGY